MITARNALLLLTLIGACTTNPAPSGDDVADPGESGTSADSTPASDDVDPWGDGDSGKDTGRYHPENYAGAHVHGPDTRLQVTNCMECHGENLDGGTSKSSCDPCHQQTWRTDCVYCHGGELDTTGAPPRDLDGTTAPDAISFTSHPVHADLTKTDGNACFQCHPQPEDVTTPGHLVDATPGEAEVSFTDGIATATIYDRASGCDNVYCHGNGQRPAAHVDIDEGPLACDGCHADIDSGPSPWAQMSGEHHRHLTHGMTCADCHATASADGRSLAQPLLHVDGKPNFKPDSVGAFNRNAIGCTGLCHDQVHFFDGW